MLKLVLFLMMLLFSMTSYADEGLSSLGLSIIEEGVPTAGKQVKVYLDEYPGIYYLLFLPYNFTNASRCGVVCEVSYEGFRHSVLGYGISKGLDYILVSLPILNTKGDGMLKNYYPEDPLPTANCWLAILSDLNKKFRIDTNKIILSGFSRGAVCVNYIGNCNDFISSKWAGYFASAHFDGCCQTIPENPYERMKRIKNRKVLIAVGENDIAKICSKNAYLKLKNLRTPVTYIEFPDIHTDHWKHLSHNPFWLFEESEASKKARQWLDPLGVVKK